MCGQSWYGASVHREHRYGAIARAITIHTGTKLTQAIHNRIEYKQNMGRDATVAITMAVTLAPS